MQAVIKDLTEFSTSLAIASSIWLLRKRKRWARLRAAWRQWLRGGSATEAGAASPGAEAASALKPEAAPAQLSAVRSVARRASTPLEHIEVVEDSDWQAWEAAVALQDSHGRAA